MEGTLTERSFLGTVLIRLRRNLPATVVILGTILLAVVIGVKSGPAQLINVVVTGGMWALLAAGLALIFGVMNIPHFAHGESFMVGAYVGYFVITLLGSYLEKNPNPMLRSLAPNIGVLVAMVFGAVMGVFIEKVAIGPLRKRTRVAWVMNTFLLTVGMSFVLTNGFTLLLGPNFRGIPAYFDVEPVEMLGVRLSVDRLWAFGVAIIVIALLTLFMQRTKTGRAIRAVSQDETGAELVGISLSSIYTLTFALATAMAAMAGAAMLFMFPAYPTVGLKPLYISWYVVVLVGLGNVYGAIVGGFIVAVLQTATQQFIGIAWEDVFPTIVMILVLLVVPSGIFGSEVKGVQEQ